MKRMSQKALAILLCTLATTPVLAQTKTKPNKPSKPIVLRPPYPGITAEGPAIHPDPSYYETFPSAPDSVVPIYKSKIHALALRGISFTDSTAVKALILKQITDLRSDKAHILLSDTADAALSQMDSLWAVRPGEYGTKRREYLAAVQRVQQFDAEFFKQRLPDVRAILSPDQQATFDQNVKVLAESDYMLFDEEGESISLYHLGYRHRPKK